METKEATTQILSWGKEFLTLSGSDLAALSAADPLCHQYEKNGAKKVIYGIDVPEVLPNRVDYFNSFIKSEKTTINSGRRYKVELFPSEVLILILLHIMEMKSILLIQNFQVDSSDFYNLTSSSAFLTECCGIFGDDAVITIDRHINADYSAKELEMWKDMTDGQQN